LIDFAIVKVCFLYKKASGKICLLNRSDKSTSLAAPIIADNRLCSKGLPNKKISTPTSFNSCARSLNIDKTLMDILDRGIASGAFRQLDSFQAAINIMGTCLFYFIGAGNIQKHPQGRRLLSKAMLEQHIIEAVAFTLAGVKQS
jgi:hypothetical protein